MNRDGHTAISTKIAISVTEIQKMGLRRSNRHASWVRERGLSLCGTLALALASA